MDNPDPTFLLGVTGGIGSGKTTVCHMLEELGAGVFYADREARHIIEENRDVRSSVEQNFGTDVYSPEGKLNAAILADRVFGQRNHILILNQIVHPHVYACFQKEAERARKQKAKVLVMEAALIYESQGYKYLDAVAVVEAAEGERLRRVAQRDGIDPAKIQERMQHQLPPEKLSLLGDFVLYNNSSKEDLRLQVEGLWNSILP